MFIEFEIMVFPDWNSRKCIAIVRSLTRTHEEHAIYCFNIMELQIVAMEHQIRLQWKIIVINYQNAVTLLHEKRTHILH